MCMLIYILCYHVLLWMNKRYPQTGIVQSLLEIAKHCCAVRLISSNAHFIVSKLRVIYAKDFQISVSIFVEKLPRFDQCDILIFET